jgi:hypothetical protein
VGAPTRAPDEAPALPTSAVTPGRIRCGDQSCALDTEACCTTLDGKSPHCAAKSKTNKWPCKDDEVAKHCDESADCKAGALCCKTWDCSGGCPPKFECEAPKCLVEIAETCLAGSQCSAGFHCSIGPGEEQGTCVMDSPGTECGGARCEGETPVCRWDRAARQGSCVAKAVIDWDAPDLNVAWLGCASPRDCLGYTCGTMGDMPVPNYFCAPLGFAGDRFSPILCSKVGDCPKHWGAAAIDCAPPKDKEAPSFTRVCVYPEE